MDVWWGCVYSEIERFLDSDQVLAGVIMSLVGKRHIVSMARILLVDGRMVPVLVY